MSATSAGRLECLRVLELGSHIAGPFCTRQLADMGARVPKVEPPGTGDPLRTWSVVTFVPRCTEAPSSIRWHGPRVGEHTAALLGSELGRSEEELAGLSASGVIGLDQGPAPAR